MKLGRIRRLPTVVLALAVAALIAACVRRQPLPRQEARLASPAPARSAAPVAEPGRMQNQDRLPAQRRPDPQAQAGPPAGYGDDDDIAVQTRGPVHEAFADLVEFDAEPSVEVTHQPPDLIEEIPPDQRPEGNEAIWISGYWAWDDERDDFLWVSGVWRIPPPDREWVPGYWHRAGRGWRWVGGFWAESGGGEVAEVTYYAPPPESMEAGPSSPPPSEAHIWSPGCWTWVDYRYVWRPGFWIVASPDWVWVPACYRWTPCGYVFVEGRWDYVVDRRGVLFAPVVFRRPVTYVSYRFVPTIAVDFGALSIHLFSRPRYCHYYFGDWYAPDCWNRGIYPTFAFHMSVYGYDPFYQHRRWEHRRDVVKWERKVYDDFHHFRDNERARPPRTFRDQQSFRGDGRGETMMVARPLKELSVQRTSKVRLEAVPEADRQKIAGLRKQRAQAVEERVKTETRIASRTEGGRNPEAKPEKGKLSREPVGERRQAKARPPAAPPEVAKPSREQGAPGRGREGERPAPERGAERPAPERGAESERPAPGRREAPSPERKPEGVPPGRDRDATPPARRGESEPRERAPEADRPPGRPTERAQPRPGERRPERGRRRPEPQLPPRGAERPPEQQPERPGDRERPEPPPRRRPGG